MPALLENLLHAARSGRRVAYTSLVETRGSTPQKAGARMLVFDDGSQAGTLGGGCVEAEVKRKALECLFGGTSTLAAFQLDHDYGWDDGLICGGRMTVLIDPVRSDRLGYYEAGLRAFQSRRGFTEAVTIDDRGPDAPLERLLLDGDGKILAEECGPSVSERVRRNLRPLSERPLPYVREGVSYLPWLPPCRLLIVGAGHVGRQVAQYAADVDFEVWVADDREIYCNAEQIPWAEKHLTGRFEETLGQLEIDENTFCVIVTRGHNHDEEALGLLIRKQPRYLGMIGSKRKIRLIFEDLRREGVPESLLERVHAPIGLDICSRTVTEIAVSIVAQLIACRNRPRGSA